MKNKKLLTLFLYIFLVFSLCHLPVDAKESLSARKKAAADDIYQCLLEFDTYIDISEYEIPYSDTTATDLFDRALDKDLYLFNVLANISDFSNDDSFCSCYTDGDYLVAFEFNYKNRTPETLTKQYKKLQTKVTSIVKALNLSKLSDEWAVTAVHDYIALHTDYDSAKNPKRQSYTAYGALIAGKAVCSGYSTACELLLDHIGISTRIVTSDSMDHAWNLVKINKKWYHMDITWDDPDPDQDNYVSYRYFLKTDSEYTGNKETPHYGWKTSIKCTSTKYSKIPATDNSKLTHRGRYWYYTKKNNNGTYSYRRYNFSFSDSTKLFTSYIKPKTYASRIYYAPKKNQISSANLNGTSKRRIKKLSSSSKLTSIRLKSNKVYYNYTRKNSRKSGKLTLTKAMKKTS